MRHFQGNNDERPSIARNGYGLKEGDCLRDVQGRPQETSQASYARSILQALLQDDYSVVRQISQRSLRALAEEERQTNASSEALVIPSEQWQVLLNQQDKTPVSISE